jgi:hypothetical protein
MTDNKISVAHVSEACIDDLNIAVLEDSPIYKDILKCIDYINGVMTEYSADDMSAMMKDIRHEIVVLNIVFGNELRHEQFVKVKEDKRIIALDHKQISVYQVDVFNTAKQEFENVKMCKYLKGMGAKSFNMYRYMSKMYAGDNKEDVLKTVAELDKLNSEVSELDKLLNASNGKPTLAQKNRYGHAINAVANKTIELEKLVGKKELMQIESIGASYAEAIEDTFNAQIDALNSLLSVLRIRKAELNKLDRIERAKTKKDKLKGLNELYKKMMV